MGWYAALTGAWIKGWAEAQQEHYKRMRSNKEGLRWLAALIRKLWQVSWNMWQHRNGIAAAQAEKERQEETERQIQDEYDTGFEGLARHIRGITSGGLEATLRLSTTDREAWLRQVTAARATKEASGLQQQRNFMQRWLGQQGHSR